MTRKPGGKNNSFKHGTFAGNFVTLPDEKHDEFELLHLSLIKEWKPTGALEEDAVFSLAQCIWLKRRVDRFYYWEAMRARDHPNEDLLNRVDWLGHTLDETAKFEDVMEVINQLPEYYKTWIERKIPRSKFKDEKSWIQSVKSEIHSLVVAHENILIEETQDPRFKAEKATKLRELTAKKIALDERLDARIDKALKRLAQLKTFKQMLEDRASLAKTVNHRRISDQSQ